MKQPRIPTFRSYALVEVLHGDQRLILNREARIVTLISDGDEFAAQLCFPAEMLALTQVLLDAYPAPCPQAVLYAVFAGVEFDVAREILKALFDASVLDLALRGLDGVLADCRAKLAALNLGVQPVPEEDGYRLFRLSLV